MSVYGDPVTIGGGGGSGVGPKTITVNGTYNASSDGLAAYNPVTVSVNSGGNAYAGDAPPTASVGSNGDYYFEMKTRGPGMVTPYTSSANSTGGYRFQVGAADITVIGLRVKLRANITGTIKLGTSDGTLLASASASYNDGDWREVMLDEPVTLEAGETYAVVFEGSSSSMYYNENPTTYAGISYITGLTGTFPGTPYSGYSFSADIITMLAEPYSVKKQYYKSGGAWAEVT